MYVSISTANLYQLPFETTLEIYARAGFRYLELDLFWEYEDFAMAQHLKGLKKEQVMKLVQDHGLEVSSLHDGGGILLSPDSPAGHTNPLLDEYLQVLDGKTKEIVIHTPHIKGSYSNGFWQKTFPMLTAALEKYRQQGYNLNIENMPTFEGFSVALLSAQELLDFVNRYDYNITLDVVHYAQIRSDYLQAARLLREKVRSVHLSDYYQGKTHVLIGEGELNLKRFLAELDLNNLHSLTLECSAAYLNEDVSKLNKVEVIERVQTIRERIMSWLDEIRPDLDYQI